jgi:hypothetical protein
LQNIIFSDSNLFDAHFFTPLLFWKIDFSIFPRQVLKKKTGANVLSFRQYFKFLNENGENRSPLINASRPPSTMLSIANEVPPPSFIFTNLRPKRKFQYQHLL